MAEVETISLHSEADRTKLKGFIDEAVLCKQRIKMENESIKDIRDEARDNLGIPPKIFNRLIKAAFKDAFAEERQDFEEFESIVELLYPEA